MRSKKMGRPLLQADETFWGAYYQYINGDKSFTGAARGIGIDPKTFRRIIADNVTEVPLSRYAVAVALDEAILCN